MSAGSCRKGSMFSKIAAVEVFFPDKVLPIREVEERLLAESSVRLPVRTISRLTGVTQVFVKSDSFDASDLAVEAAKKALKSADVEAGSLDLLIFASASQDLIEPATAHIVAQKLGATCPVMDVKNACNSFLNGVQVADLFIRSGQHGRVLVVTGETPSVSVRWVCNSKEQFLQAFPGYSMSDSGGAMLLESVNTEADAGVLKVRMSANSDLWRIGILDTGGSRNPRDIDTTYFNIDGGKLFSAFKSVGCEMLFEEVASGLDWSDYKHVGVHQVSTTYTGMLTEELGIPNYKLVETMPTFGNVASNSLPLQMSLTRDDGLLNKGDLFAFIGLGGGISTGLGVFKF